VPASAWRYRGLLARRARAGWLRDALYTPHVGKSWLWETSGHLDFYKENMYSPMELDNADYYAKPMNCPFHILIYKTLQAELP
jgi:threonyl-tRNA synthetase